MSEYIEEVEEGPSSNRPKIISVLTILTFIWTGLILFFTFVSLTIGPQDEEQQEIMNDFYDQSIEDVEGSGSAATVDWFEKMKIINKNTNDNFYLAKGVDVGLGIIGLVAAILMRRGRKIGFHLYIIYGIVYVCSYYFYVSPADIPTPIIIFYLATSVIFITLYSRGLKWMT